MHKSFTELFLIGVIPLLRRPNIARARYCSDPILRRTYTAGFFVFGRQIWDHYCGGSVLLRSTIARARYSGAHYTIAEGHYCKGPILRRTDTVDFLHQCQRKLTHSTPKLQLVLMKLNTIKEVRSSLRCHQNFNGSNN